MTQPDEVRFHKEYATEVATRLALQVGTPTEVGTKKARAEHELF